MKKQQIALCMAGVCLSALLGGCQGAAETGAATEAAGEVAESGQEQSDMFDEEGRYREPVKITGILSYQQSDTDILPDEFSYIAAAKEKLNIDYEWLWTAPPEQFDQKFGVAMASGDLPDIMSLSSVDYEILRENGQLADLTDTLEYACDELKEYLYRDPEVLEALKVDGRLYTIPRYYDTRREMNMLYIRQDWLDELNLEVPKTVDELETVMDAFQKKTGAAQAIALSGTRVSDWGLDVKGILNMFGGAPYSWIDKGDGNLVPGEIQPEVRTGLEAMARWYQAGYINREFVAMDVGKAEEDVIAGKTGLLLGPWWMYENAIGLVLEKDPDAKWVTAPIPSNGDGKPMVPRRAINSYYGVNKNCEHPEALILLLNMTLQGETGAEDWTKSENGYFWSWNPTLYTDPYDIRANYETFQEALAKDPGATGDAPESMTEAEKEVWEHMADYLAYKNEGVLDALPEDAAVFGYIMARIDEDGGWASVEKISEGSDFIYNEYYGPATEAQKEHASTLEKLVDETYLKIIMGELPIEAFDQFVEDWKVLGGDEITQEVNDWYQKNRS